jgi:hypothetical protein
MMDFELRLEQPTWQRAYVSAGTMAFSYFIGTLPCTLAEKIRY